MSATASASGDGSDLNISLRAGSDSGSQATEPSRKRQEVQSLLELIGIIKTKSIKGGHQQNKVDSAVSLNEREIPLEHIEDGLLTATTDTLGSGNTAGQILVVRDPSSGKKFGEKTVAVVHFRSEEIRVWVNLHQKGLAPELYAFRLVNSEVKMYMQILEGKDMKTVINDIWAAQIDQKDRQSFALVILNDLLQNYQTLMDCKVSHSDLHSGNAFLEKKTMKLKFIDFGSARNHLVKNIDETGRNIQFDIIGIIRIFTALYSAHDLDGPMNAKVLLMNNNLDTLNEFFQHLSAEDRQEMYHIILELFETARDPRQAGFGDTQEVRLKIQRYLSPASMLEIKKKLATILFPELLQRPAEQADTMEGSEDEENYVMEGATVDSVNLPVFDPYKIWHDPRLEKYASQVTPKVLKNLGLH